MFVVRQRRECSFVVCLLQVQVREKDGLSDRIASTDSSAGAAF